jgi:hypothetical protein
VEFEQLIERGHGIAAAVHAGSFPPQPEQPLGRRLGGLDVRVNSCVPRDLVCKGPERKAAVRALRDRLPLQRAGGEEVAERLLASTAATLPRTAHEGLGEGDGCADRWDAEK